MLSLNLAAGEKKFKPTKCQRAVKKEVKKFERFNPGRLERLDAFKTEAFRVGQLEQYKELAIEEAKKIEHENGEYLSVDSFFSSNRPIDERNSSIRPPYHPLIGNPQYHDTARSSTTINFYPTGEENKHVKTEEYEVDTVIHYIPNGSSENELSLSVSFDRGKLNCELNEWDLAWDNVLMFDTKKEAIAYYDEQERLGWPEKGNWTIHYYERLKKFNVVKKNGKFFNRDCESHPLAGDVSVSVNVRKDSDGRYVYSSDLGRTNLYGQDDKASSETLKILSDIGFIEPTKKGAKYPNLNLRNIHALSAFVKKEEAALEKYFKGKLGSACFEQFSLGNIEIKNGESKNVTNESYAIVRGLNRSMSIEIDKKTKRIATSRQNQSSMSSN